MSRAVCLDLFCGGGGASMGLYRAGFDVVGVDIKPQPHYPAFHDTEYASHFKFIQADAMTFPLDGYDCYWASPPCQAYMDTNKNGAKERGHPRLIGPTRERLSATGKPYIIENVHKSPLRAGVLLCGTMFGLHVIRHRYFETSFPFPMSPYSCNHWGSVAKGDFVGAYGRGGKGPRHGAGIREAAPWPAKLPISKAMGIDWMAHNSELFQAIPPAFSEYLGKYMLSAVISVGHQRADSGRGHKYDTCASLDPDIQTQRKNALAGNESSEHSYQLRYEANGENFPL